MPQSLPAPLGGAAPAEVPLERAPLERVLMQVRFSTVLKMESREGIAAFQDQIRADYPLFESLVSQQLQVDLGSGTPGFHPVTTTLWQFSDAAQTVRLTVGSEAATLEALTYEGRSGFLARWIEILVRLQALFAPGLVTRAGARYVNRFQGETLARLTELVRPSFVGVAQPELRAYVAQALSEASLTVEEGQMNLRWGVLAENTTIDPALLTPLPEPSWILDIDVFNGVQIPFDAEGLADTFEALAQRAYALFRYAMKDDALTYFGSAA